MCVTDHAAKGFSSWDLKARSCCWHHQPEQTWMTNGCHTQNKQTSTYHTLHRKKFINKTPCCFPLLSPVSSSRGWRGLLQKAEEIGSVTGLGIGNLIDMGDLPRQLTQLLTHLQNLAKLLFSATAPLPDSIWPDSVWSYPNRPIPSRQWLLPLANFGEKQPIGLDNMLGFFLKKEVDLLIFTRICHAKNKIIFSLK